MNGSIGGYNFIHFPQAKIASSGEPRNRGERGFAICGCRYYSISLCTPELKQYQSEYVLRDVLGYSFLLTFIYLTVLSSLNPRLKM